MIEMAFLSILAILGWAAYLRERSISGRWERTVDTLNEAIEYKNKTIGTLREQHSDLASRAQHFVELYDKGALKLEKDSSAIEFLRIHANSVV